MTEKLYSRLVCALTHNMDVCDRCKKCGNSGAEARVNLLEQLIEEEKEMHKVPYSYSEEEYAIDVGVMKKHNYQIWWISGWPTAYVLPLKPLTEDEIEQCHCHGGITYEGSSNPLDRLQRQPYIGWDYSHWGDYRCSPKGMDSMCNEEDHKWTYGEILQEVKNIIEYLIKIGK